VDGAARWVAELEEIGDVIKESEMALKKIAEVMSRWEEVQMEVREHDYHVSELLQSDSHRPKSVGPRTSVGSRTD
jgi:hypothetical protein